MQSPLVLNSFSKYYGSDTGAQDVSLELHPGEVFGFLGPNGAGKTTTIRAILNFIRPSSGNISVFGLDSVKEDVTIKRSVGYLAGDIALYSDMSGRQVLRYLTSLGKATDWDYVAELQAAFAAQLDRPIKNLSKGNKQKIGLIQALMHKPELVLLDEPTSGLDPLMQQTFYDVVETIKKEGRTLFISSHNLQEVQRLCDRAAFIRRGALIGIEEIGSGQELNFRRYNVRFGRPPKQTELENMPGVTEVRLHKDEAFLTVMGDINTFLQSLSKYHVLDLGEAETNLEDVFMHYYREEADV